MLTTSRSRRAFLLGATGAALVACGTPGAPPGRTRTVDSVHGPVSVPERARRVVCLDLSKIQRMLDVGVTPVGVPDDWQPGPEHAAWYAGAARTGTQAAPDIEAVAALAPDLVLGSPQSIDQRAYDRLSTLAPTVVLAAPGAGSRWKELSEADAVAAGRPTGLATVRARYAARVAELRRTCATGLTRRFGVLYGTSGGALLLLPDSGPGTVLSALGVRFAAAAEAGRTGVFRRLSYEQLGELSDAELLLLDANADGSLTPATTAVRAQPTFTALSARSAPVSRLIVFSYGEALGLLDQLEDLLR